MLIFLSVFYRFLSQHREQKGFQAFQIQVESCDEPQHIAGWIH